VPCSRTCPARSVFDNIGGALRRRQGVARLEFGRAVKVLALSYVILIAEQVLSGDILPSSLSDAKTNDLPYNFLFRSLG
jgi:hypothetical protein